MLIGKLKLNKQPYKTLIVFVIEFLAVFILKLPAIKIKNYKILDKNKTIEGGNKYGIINSIAKKIILVNKTNNKFYKSKTYEKAITEFIYSK